MSGYFAWLLWLIAHIWFLIGFRNRVVVMFDWAWAYWTFERHARIVTGDTARREPRPSVSRPAAPAPRALRAPKAARRRR
jgi:NADH dehydrogenase